MNSVSLFRYVTREVIEDDLGQTPEEGSSTDGDESYDGDGDQFHNRKEERFIDYYRSAGKISAF